MGSEWTPPPDGTPCWINIFATDVPRARKFYEEAFGWKFRDETIRSDGIEEDPNKIAHFDLGPKCTSGGITKVKEVVRTEGKGGNVLYLWAEDLGVVEKRILAAGGKKMTEVMPEGKRAHMQHFEDTENNWIGLYSMNK